MEIIVTAATFYKIQMYIIVSHNVGTYTKL